MGWTRQNGNSSTNTVAWTIVQRVCGPLPMKSFRTTFHAARWVKHLEYHETRWDPDGTRWDPRRLRWA